MDLFRGINISNNYNTELYDVILDLPHDILFNNEHELREPLGIYNVSFKRVINGFQRILKEIQNSDVNWENIDLCHKELLDSIMAYIDDGYLIMKCLYPKVSVKENIVFADLWVKKIDESFINEYKKKIEPYRNKLALIINRTKHNHARYCHIEMSTNFGKVLGYYIEGVKAKGACHLS